MSPVRARRFLYVSGFIRAMATSTAGVTMGGFLGRLDAHGTELGLVVSAGLAGAAASAVVATLAADRIGYDILLWRAFRGTKPPEECV